MRTLLLSLTSALVIGVLSGCASTGTTTSASAVPADCLITEMGLNCPAPLRQ